MKEKEEGETRVLWLSKFFEASLLPAMETRNQENVLFLPQLSKHLCIKPLPGAGGKAEAITL